ncbi:hypothetical protein [Psychrobacter aquimaris]|jgi:hypothetical protein|uniref:hypothetical protein n=1 Tax=Psychrobacter aquimaris TaxID=292733 RepID=UPI0018DF3A8E|nr:hypothetical protein [Psychrobacter aquimaris]|tara:strand:+ start:1158 stop:1421 length:264 start_codon:yes stop_codon:yes gene_type:complete
MEFEVKQITQEEIDKQNTDKENGQPFIDDIPIFLQQVKAGDYVANGEFFVGRNYAHFLPILVPELPDEEKEEWSALVIQLDKLNNKV